MKKKTDLKSYLHLWKDHFSADVVGQSAGTQHLDSEKLRKMVAAGGINNADPADIEHLSTCPDCIEEWSRLCAQNAEGEPQSNTASMPISYGVFDVDVTGQSENLTLVSSCKKFTLTIGSSQDESNLKTISLKVSDPYLEDSIIQIRDRNGIIIAEGKIDKGEITANYSSLPAFDLTVWTLLKKSS